MIYGYIRVSSDKQTVENAIQNNALDVIAVAENKIYAIL